MKKFFTKIIISAVMVAIFLAPASSNVQKNNEGGLTLDIKNNIALAQADSQTNTASNPPAATGPTGCTSIQTTPCFNVTQIQAAKDFAIIDITIKNTIPDENLILQANLYLNSTYIPGADANSQPTPLTITEEFLAQNTPSQNKQLIFNETLNTALTPNTAYWLVLKIKRNDTPIPGEFQESTYTFISGGEYVNQVNTQTDPNAVTETATPKEDFNYNCDFTNIGGCIAGITYFIFAVISWFAEKAAGFLDFFIYYSTNSSSYNSSFVGTAWASVRDIANVFFIVALLYVAIQTILGLGHHGKKMIATIVIVALLINFSLFFTKVIIDASNILAKVFYNNIENKDKNGQKNVTGDYGGERSITVGLVQMFNPQDIIKQNDYNANGGVTLFIEIALLSSLVSGILVYIFLSVALLFVGRVAGLWIAMIMAPIAFASYTIPSTIPGLGHEKWWSNLLKQAFMAPIFIFFLYIILLFRDAFGQLAGDVKATVTDIDGLMHVLIPFALVSILLIQAKKLAVEYSGDIGAAITSAGAAIGGLAFGGVALGTAFLGRQTVGRFMKGASTGDTAAQRYERGESRGIADKAIGGIGSALNISGLERWAGSKLNQQQHDIEHAAHARHDLDTEAGVVAHGKKWSELNVEQMNQARTNIARKEQMRLTGLGKKKWSELTDAERTAINTAIAPALATKTSVGDTKIREAKEKQGLGVNLAQSTIGGSFDVRNISKIVAGEQDKSFNKFATGVSSLIAGGMRSSIKGTFGANYGEGQKDIMKDLGHTITEALKGAKISVDLSSVGKEVKEGHGGGGGGHGGGGHH